MNLKQFNKYLFSYTFTVISCVLFLAPNISNAQINLVPNPSFEDTVACPYFPGQINYATFWANPTMASPDYFNSCNTGMVGVPSNYMGIQNAHSGSAYGLLGCYGLALSPTLSYREYIQVPLPNVLLSGESYCVEFYVSLANGQYTEYAVNNIGAYFSATAVSALNYDPLPYVPQIENASSNPLTTLGVWTKISGSFTAQGGEQFLTIGNFNSNAASDTVFIKPTAGSDKQSAYYIDDVSVIHLDADAGKDTAICLGNNITLGRATSPGISYSWQPAPSLSNTNIAQPIATPTITTTYYLTATLNGGCSKSDSITITVVNANAGNDTTFCNGGNITLGSSALTGVTYNWLPTAGLNNSAIAQPIAAPTNPITYTVTASANGCTLTDDVTVTVLPYQTPIANAGSSNTICAGDTINIGSFATTGFTYSWSPTNYLNDAHSSSPFAFPNQTTLYTLTVTDTASNYLCKASGTDSILITIDQCPPEIPNVFTPNNDGFNDEFTITNLTQGSSVTIYDRWGIVVFQLATNNNKQQIIKWDGRTTSGLACADGVYFYLVSLSNGETYKGYLELLR